MHSSTLALDETTLVAANTKTKAIKNLMLDESRQPSAAIDLDFAELKLSNRNFSNRAALVL